jgi:dephospho-CoA kinase
MSNKLVVAVVGLCGAGKSEVAKFFENQGFANLRFGQITLDIIKQKGLEVNEQNERQIREGLRQEYGMAAFAILNIPKIDELRAAGNSVLADGLYSWSEYKVLKDKYGVDLKVIAVYAPPELRYARLSTRAERHGADDSKLYRSISPADALRRDHSEIENIEKAGPIAMADYTLSNTGTIDELKESANNIYHEIIA